MDFFSIGIIDIIDIILVALLMFQLYKLIKGTSAFSIFIGIFVFYLLWIVVKALNMELLSSILGQVIGVGVIALIVVFQQEIRRFLLYLGNRYFSKMSSRWGQSLINSDDAGYIDDIVTACENMSQLYTGALIVFARKNNLNMVQETGDLLKARVSSRLIETIFFKNSPMHDGAMVVVNGRIESARCVLPQTERVDLPAYLGMRHRAAIGISEVTDAIVVVVSEESGRISYIENGRLYANLTTVMLKEKLVKNL